MEKLILKKVISNLVNGDKININYLSNTAKHMYSGEYVVVGIKRGRGKGGSMLAELKSDSSTNNLVLSTKDSDCVLNIVHNGAMYGYEVESEVPPVFEKNAWKAVELKSYFKIFEKATKENPMKIRVKSTITELNNTHEIVSMRQLRGRSGQIVLTTSTGLEIWSYRHSGVIDTIEAV